MTFELHPSCKEILPYAVAVLRNVLEKQKIQNGDHRKTHSERKKIGWLESTQVVVESMDGQAVGDI